MQHTKAKRPKRLHKCISNSLSQNVAAAAAVAVATACCCRCCSCNCIDSGGDNVSSSSNSDSNSSSSQQCANIQYCNCSHKSCSTAVKSSRRPGNMLLLWWLLLLLPSVVGECCWLRIKLMNAATLRFVCSVSAY